MILFVFEGEWKFVLKDDCVSILSAFPLFLFDYFPNR